jgi:predicted transcriptional regulator
MFKLSEAEFDVMLVLWECTEPIRPSQLLVRLNACGHTWSISTLQTLLARLRSKKAVTMESKKRFHYYIPSVTREDFLAGTIVRLSNRLSTYSPINLAAGLVDNELLIKWNLASAAQTTEKQQN